MRNTAQPCFPTNVALPRRTVLRSRVLISYGADPPIGHWRLAPGTKPLPGQQGKRPMEPDSKGPHALRVFSSKPQKEGMKNMTSVNPVLVISPEKEHHEKINAAMSKCGLSSISCMTFEEARIFVSAQKFGVVFCHDTLPDGDFCSVVSAAKPTQSSCCRVSPNGIITLPLSAPEPSITSHARLIPPKQNASRGQQWVAVAKTHKPETPLHESNRLCRSWPIPH